MDVAALIKKEMTPKTVTHWGQPYENHTPILIDAVHGDGLCLIYLCPLATRPDYYIIRVDSSVKKMVEDNDDEICDFLEEFIHGMIKNEHGSYDDHEDYYEKDIMIPWPALNMSCGSGWGLVE